MVKEYKPFVRETLADVLPLVRQRFNEEACEITRLALKNPYLQQGSSSGAVGYKDGQPVAFQIEMPRDVYLGTERLHGLIGGMTCKAEKGTFIVLSALNLTATLKTPASVGLIK